MYLEYSATHENVFHPTRNNPSDVGLDLYFSPDVAKGEFDETKNMPKGSILILPGNSAKLRTGLRFGVPHGYCLEIKNRSSVSSKRELLVGGGIIDPGYSGEVLIVLHNIGKNPQLILPGEKIAQAVLYPVIHVRPMLSVDGDLYGKESGHEIAISKREEKGFGSSDQKLNTKEVTKNEGT